MTAVTHIKGKDPKEKERDKEKERERERERAAANAVKQQLAAQPGLQCALRACRERLFRARVESAEALSVSAFAA